ncbi:galacturonan 1,4-alpha-galacturonidase [Sarracenia purpurea var. burkii]
MLFIAYLIWSSQIDTCNARRRGKHWRQKRAAATSASLYKKKIKSSQHHNNAGKSNPQVPSPKSPSPTLPPPLPPPPLAPKKDIPPSPPKKGYSSRPSTVFNVLGFGAEGDGKSDDTKAFQAAWAAACKVEASTIMVPSKFTFLVGPISFSGPYCQPNIVFQLDGTILAPTSSQAWGSGILQWLEFTKLRGITVRGTGTIDGRGSIWWQDSQYDDPIDNESKLIVPLNSTVEENPPIPGGSGSVQGVLFSNIQVSEVQLPIIIDQYYCDKSECKNQTSAVALSGITYEKIRGTYTVKPVHLACSDSLPCVDVGLTDIELKPQQEQYHMYDAFCWQTFGELNTPTVPPIDCLHIGKPSSNRIQNDHDLC